MTVFCTGTDRPVLALPVSEQTAGAVPAASTKFTDHARNPTTQKARHRMNGAGFVVGRGCRVIVKFQ